MAGQRSLSPAVHRRRIAVAVLFVTVVAVAAGVSVAALRRHGHAAAPPAPPPPKPFRIVFPEGFTRAQDAVRVRDVARIAVRERHRPVRLTEASYLAASQHAVVPCFGKGVQPSLEGFLFPATYDFVAATTAKQLVRSQIRAFCRNWSRVNQAYARSKNLTPYDVLKIGSMVEEEAAVQHDRPLVAAVIYNRLHDRMQLGIDATLRYGLHIPPTKSITQSELASNSPYNSRKLAGLPPTPIGNPGLASLRAAARPAGVDYLYYVRIPGTHRHFFTASASAFDQYLATHGYK